MWTTSSLKMTVTAGCLWLWKAAEETDVETWWDTTTTVRTESNRNESKKKCFTISSKVDQSILTFTEKIVTISFCIVLVRMWKIAIRIVFHIFVASKQQLLEDTSHMSKYKLVWLILARLALEALAYGRAWMFIYWFKFSNTNPLQTYKLERWTSYFHSVQKRQNKEKNIKERDKLLK